MKEGRTFPAIALLFAATAAHAFEADGCEKQRKLFPANWNDTSKDKTL